MDQLEDDELPEPKFPSFFDARAEGFRAEFLADSVKTVNGGQGQDAKLAKSGQPPGWGFVEKNGLSKDAAWVRMHLLPERLGGKATGNNLVPARGPRTNTKFLNEIEDEAYQSVPRPEKIIWYETVVQFGYSRLKDFADFPSYIYSAYGGYKKVRGSGKKRSDWTRTGTKKAYYQHTPPPRQDEAGTLFVNMDGRKRLGDMLECSDRLADHVIDGRDDAGGKYNNASEVALILRTKKRNMRADAMPGLNEMLVKLRALDAKHRVDWSK